MSNIDHGMVIGEVDVSLFISRIKNSSSWVLKRVLSNEDKVDLVKGEF